MLVGYIDSQGRGHIEKYGFQFVVNENEIPVGSSTSLLTEDIFDYEDMTVDDLISNLIIKSNKTYDRDIFILINEERDDKSIECKILNDKLYAKIVRSRINFSDMKKLISWLSV